MSDGGVIRQVLRNQAWQRAKGELEAVLDTYYGEYDKFVKMERAVREFIQEVEDNGWQE